MPRIITLLTDFSPADTYAAQMKGVILGVAPGARVIDLCCGIALGDVRSAQFRLAAAHAAFPRGAIHVCVVDPGVGTARRILAARARGQTFLAPDNGLLTFLFKDPALALRSVENEAWMRKDRSRTFHGRDVFAPVAARLAAGAQFEKVGPEVCAGQVVWAGLPEPEAGAGTVDGEVMMVDGFGNCVTNIREQDLAAAGIQAGALVSAGKRVSAPLVGTYMDVEQGAALALVGSSGRVEISINGGSAAERLGLKPGSPVSIGHS